MILLPTLQLIQPTQVVQVVQVVQVEQVEHLNRLNSGTSAGAPVTGSYEVLSIAFIWHGLRAGARMRARAKHNPEPLMAPGSLSSRLKIGRESEQPCGLQLIRVRRGVH